MLLPAIGLAVGSGLVASAGGAIWIRGAGVFVFLCAAIALLLLIWQFNTPRVAYANGQLLIYVRLGLPARIPIDAVEGFLLGQGATFLPGARRARSQTSTVVIRLAERFPELANGEFHPALGTWCGGYITIRGTWCEPLDLALVQSLNAKLAEAQRAAHQPETVR
jgi:hypothetical protein